MVKRRVRKLFSCRGQISANKPTAQGQLTNLFCIFFLITPTSLFFVPNHSLTHSLTHHHNNINRPGSSSLLGYVQEVGPLLMNASGSLMENPYAWTKAGVNLLAIEAPMGVGFSYCSAQEQGQPCTNSDTSTAHVSRAALVDFFQHKFPELAAGPFYIAGTFLCPAVCVVVTRNDGRPCIVDFEWFTVGYIYIYILCTVRFTIL